MRAHGVGRYHVDMKKNIFAALLTVALAVPAAAEKPAMAELLRAAGMEFAPSVATPAGAPVSMTGAGTVRASGNPLEKATIVCVMDFEYRETISQLIIVRVWKELNGTATITCNNMAPIKLVMRGEGLSLGLGLPNRSPFRSVNGVVGGDLAIRLPALFVPRQLEGSYHNIGGEVFGGGVSFSPWVNSDGSFNTTLYLPNSFNVSAAINLQSLSLRLQ